MQSEIWSGTEALVRREAAWDDLWRRAPVTTPTARALPLASFVETFGNPDGFRAIAVWDADRLVAAVPLLAEHRGRWLHCLTLPHNAWCTGGTALVDAEWLGSPQVARRLVDELTTLEWRALLWDDLRTDEAIWTALVDVMRERGWFASWDPRASIAWLPIDRFRETLTHLSKGTRKKFRRAWRDLQSHGRVALRVVTPHHDATVARWVEQAIDIEHHKSQREGWTSIRTAGLAPFFTDQARLVSAHGEFLLSLLEVDDRPVAFEYGWLAKRTYHSLKIGYIPDFARTAPGHLLMWKLGEHLARRGDVERVDCLCDATSTLPRTWRTEAYETRRLWACRPAWLGRTLAWGLRQRRLLTSSLREADVTAAVVAPSVPG